MVACSILDQFLYPNILIVYSNFGGRSVKQLNIIILLLCILLNTQRNLAHSADLTFDISYYYYEEPNFMNDTSDPVLYTLGLRNWEVPVDETNSWQVLYTAEGTRGWVNYSGSGTLDKDYYKLRGEAYAGYQFETFTPIIGVGYRWLYDDSGGLTSSTGAFGYDRQSQYIYLPAGGIFDFDNNIKVKGQFNYLLAGRQTSYLSDVTGFTDIDNDQSSGWGVDLTIDLGLTDKTSFYSFYRHWDIDRSSTVTGTFSNVLIFQAFEPANTTTEIGIGLAYKF